MSIIKSKEVSKETSQGSRIITLQLTPDGERGLGKMPYNEICDIHDEIVKLREENATLRNQVAELEDEKCFSCGKNNVTTSPKQIGIYTRNLHGKKVGDDIVEYLCSKCNDDSKSLSKDWITLQIFQNYLKSSRIK